MKLAVVGILLMSCFVAKAQNEFEWDGKYRLTMADFKSPATRIGGANLYSVQPGTTFDFSFQMSNAEFMFTKNFNPKVSCTFARNASSLVAPDTVIAVDLVAFARYQFDLTELYARKFRKRMNEEKGAFSGADFFKPLYDENRAEFNERITTAATASDLGRNHEQLYTLHQAVLAEIEQLPNFCKSCKPPKKKK